MISVDEKLQVFSEYLLNKERSWGKGVIADAKTKQQEMVKAAEIKIATQVKAIEDRNQRTIFRDRNKIIAEGKNRAKTMELEEKNRILTDFNQLVLTLAEEYLTGQAYRDYLKGCVQQIPKLFGDKKDLTVFVNSRDFEDLKCLVDELLNDYALTYREDAREMIGGIIVEDREQRIYADFSVENLVKSHYKLIGMTLGEFMEEQVD